MCHLSLLGCPSRNSLPQSTRNPPTIHAQANPTLRPRPFPPPCSVFRLGFFSSRNYNPQKAKAETPNTLAPPARSSLLFLPLPCGVFGGVTIHPQSSRYPPAIHPQSTHKQTRPCARGHALLPARCFRLGFFPPAFSTRKKPRRKHRTTTHRPQGRVCFSPRTHSACSGVLGV